MRDQTGQERTIFLESLFACVIAPLLFACRPEEPDQVEFGEILSQPALHDDRLVSFDACLIASRHGSLIGICGADRQETAVIADADLNEASRKIFEAAWATSFSGKPVASCFTGRFRYVAGEVPTQWLDLLEFAATPCNVLPTPT